MKRNRRWIVPTFLSLGLVMMVGFQNCGQLNPSAFAVSTQASLERHSASDSEILSRLFASGNLVAWASAGSSIVTSSAGIATSVQPLGVASLTLAADGTGPSYVNNRTSSLFGFTSTANLKTSASASLMVSDQFAVVALISGTPSGQIFSIQSSPGVSDMSVVANSGLLTAANTVDTSNYASVKQTMAQSGLIVVAASFGTSVNAVLTQVQGVAPVATVVVSGSVSTTSSLQRRFILGNPSGTSSFELRELILFNQSLSAGELNAVSRYIASKWGVTNLNYLP